MLQNLDLEKKSKNSNEEPLKNWKPLTSRLLQKELDSSNSMQISNFGSVIPLSLFIPYFQGLG